MLRELASDVGAPSGLSPLGFGEADVAALAAAAYAQQRLLAVAPRPVTERDLASILHASL